MPGATSEAQCRHRSVPQIWVVGPVTECADAERRMSVRNLPSKSSQARVADTSWAQRVAVGAFYEFEPVAWAYAHRIEDAGRKCDMALCVILRSMAYSLRVCYAGKVAVSMWVKGVTGFDLW